MSFQITVHDGIADIGQAAWDACADPSGDPFVSYAFLHPGECPEVLEVARSAFKVLQKIAKSTLIWSRFPDQAAHLGTRRIPSVMFYDSHGNMRSLARTVNAPKRTVNFS